MAISTHPAPNLANLPPELLLRVISHLPTTSYLPLVQTCQGLRLFFAQHAAHICNTQIQLRFAREAEMMQTIWKDGWLVPSQPCVRREEQKLLRWKARNCSSCRLWYVSMADESKQLEAWRHYSMVGGGSSSSVEEEFGDWRSLRCTGNHANSLRVSLSEPGPQYLKFLEEYAFEIQVRWEMEQHPLECMKRDDGPDGIRTDRFEFMVGNYAVRKFLDKLDAMMEGRGALKRDLIGAGIRVGDEDLESTEKGLLWYYGRSGVAGLAPEESDYDSTFNDFSEKDGCLSLTAQRKSYSRNSMRIAMKVGKRVLKVVSCSWSWRDVVAGHRKVVAPFQRLKGT
ncbi:hypothetical protein F5884DRAFT_205206 [Xylogone sp. PMI_703]|nr:hypothetical protein F5884DRAFT_205206 [Xylogone sp. PMI_703]